ncbi:Flp family type IVb pilin [Ochrobactrum sp. POC9]|uniref:Flp family type IVb pilin n=1 Tax=Brucella/Ochrobactrum group TaxID=2826938 RepID=UPI000D706619|nr:MULTISPECIES: Flp family type IVb pilin [Brucella/Ochrobactrum group]MCH4539513.1 Flp family type IVb pilin [Ochrobactrum sp. A-1]PWU73682.1 Flp family type IVb pilin [Ochrobactrum sp. POC9]
MTKFFARFRKDESGATAIEYGLIAALISVAIIGGASTLGKDIGKKFTDISTAVTGAKSPTE